MVPKGGAGDDAKTILVETRDGEVALDAPAGVAELGIGDHPNRAGHTVGAELLEETRRAAPRDLDLRKRGFIEQPRTLATGPVLGTDRRRPQAAGPAVGAEGFVAVRGVRFE